jgi:glycerol kinase
LILNNHTQSINQSLYALGRVSGRKFVAILAIDAGTTGVTALVVNAEGEIVARGYTEFEQHFPSPGWVEHEPQQIWDATLNSCKQAQSDCLAGQKDCGPN